MLKQLDAAADAVEVYYVCLLLGFKGKYAIYGADELENTIRRTAEALQLGGRLKHIDLAPHAFVEDQPEPPKKHLFLPTWAKIIAGLGLILSVIVYFALLLVARNGVLDALKKLEF